MSKSTPANDFNVADWFKRSMNWNNWGSSWNGWPKNPGQSGGQSGGQSPGSDGASGPSTTLTVTFNSEEAGYANAMGWYNARTGEAGILFKNTNDDGWNAGVKAGDTRSLTVLQSDVDANNVGFFLIPNGANELSSSLLSSTMKFQVGSNGDGKIVIDRQYGSDVVLCGSEVLFSNQVHNKSDYDYVSGKVGTEGQTKQQKLGSQSDGPDGILGTMAWDDQSMNGCGGTDRDFNDVVFTVTKSGGTNPPPNGAPTDINLSSATITENVAGGVIGMLSTVDPNVGDKHTYSVSDSRFEVVNGQLKLTAGTSLNYENGSSVQLKVTTTDQGGLSYSENVTIAVQNVNEAPTDISISNLSVSENASGAVVGAVTTIDPDAGNTHSYSVSDSRFEVVNGQLKLIAGKSLDYETESSVQLTITTKDQGGLSYSENFTIKVNDVNEAPPNSAPTNIMLSGAAVTENVVGAVVGTLTTTDPNAGDTHTYKVDDDRFQVVGGVLQLISGVSLDYEDASSVVVNVTTTDKGGLSYSESFTIAVKDTTEAPTDIVLSPFEVDEIEFGAAVGNLTTVDDDAGDVHTYTVSDDRFEVVDGQLRLTEESSLDFETEPTVILNVTSTDTQGNSFTKAITVIVNDLNEAPSNPVDEDPAPDFVASNAAIGTTVGITASAVDPDAGDSFKFSLSGNAGGMFAIDAATGVVTVAGALEEGAQTITVRATDSHGEYSESDLVVQVGEEVQQLMAFGSSGIDTFLLDLEQAATTTLVGFNRINDQLSFSGVADANSNGSIGLSDLFAMVSGVSDFGSGGDIVVDFTTGASLVLQGAGTVGGAVNSMSNLVSSPSTQYQFA
jgi:hypothetical protein